MTRHSFLLPLACFPLLWPAIAFGVLGLADDLWGNRSVGGFRASVYNAFPLEGCQALAQLLTEFAKK